MPRAVAVNVGANTNAPGVRGPIFPDGTFEFVPIPETEPTDGDVPTYADLDLRTDLPAEVLDSPVHLDPEFAEYPCCERYTYGDPHGVKARPLLDLAAGDYALFYATLAPRGDGHPDWVVPDWGAYLVGAFELARDPVSGEEYPDLPADERAAFANNAHVHRETFDAAVLLAGTERSSLFDRPVPLSSDAGTEANRLVTDRSADSGKGPWWRRPLRFDADAVTALRESVPELPGC
ncbi:MAG: hypothetical protein ABEJ68_10410 [Halobacteriaceae archaeon]